ncbi:MAG: alpha/beta hydrolase [Oscillospiraceae bacterium]
MIAVYIVLGAAILFFLIEYIVYLIAFRGRVYHDITKTGELDTDKFKKYKDAILSGIKYAAETESEPVEITSYDGLRLAGRYYRAEKERALIILCHGYRSIADNDFSCAIQYFHESGFSLLLIDERAHGKSGGRTMTFGIKERHDVRSWVDYAAGRFPDTNIIVEGISMGASTVLMAAGEPFPPNVKGIIADCGYTSPKEIICHVIRRAHMPVKLLYPEVKLAARLFGGFDLEEYSSLEAARSASLPALFIHGESDYFVPCDMGRRNFQAYAGEKQMVTVPGAGHGLSYVVDMEKVQKAVNEFLDRIL